MNVSHIEFLVEEPSAEMFLRTLLPRLLPTGLTFEVRPFQGKGDLLKNLLPRLRGYAAWMPGDWRVVNRIAIEELEAWYFGDWGAVQRSFPGVPETIPAKAPFRYPDAIKGGTWEAFERILKDAGHHQSGLRKVEAARLMGEQLQPDACSSPSFQQFHRAVLSISSSVTAPPSPTG